MEGSSFEGILIEDDVVLALGAKVLGKQGLMCIGRGTVIEANAVLLQSTGPDEIWSGIPASCTGRRQKEEDQPQGD